MSQLGSGSIGVDLGSVLSDLPQFNAALQQNATAIENYLAIVQKTNSAGQIIEETIKSLAANGQIITQVFKYNEEAAEEGGEAWQLYSTKVEHATDVVRAFLSTQKDAAEAARLAQAAASATNLAAGYGATLPIGTADSGSTNQKKTLVSAQNQLAGAISGSGLNDQDIKTMFDRINAGFTDIETGARARVQQALIAVKKAFDDIGESSTKAAEKEISDAEKVEQALRKQIQEVKDKRQQKAIESQTPTLVKDLQIAFPAPKSGDTAALLQYQTALENLKQKVISGKLDFNQFQQAVGEVRQQAAKGEDPIKSLIGKFDPSLISNIKSVGDASSEASKKGAEGWSKYFISFSGLVRLFESQIVRTAFKTLIKSAEEEVAEIFKLEDALRHVAAISNLAIAEFDGLTNKLNDLSISSGKARSEILNIATEEFGARLKNVADSTEILSRGFQLAEVTGGNAKQSVALLRETLDVYHLSANNAATASATLFAAIQAGGLNVKDFEAGFAKLEITAQQAGISLNDAAGGVVALSNAGLSTKDSINSLEQVITLLQRGGPEIQEMFEKWGFANANLAFSTLGLSGVLAKLKDEMDNGTIKSTSRLHQSLETIRGSAALLGSKGRADIDNFNKGLEGSAERLKASADTADKTRGIFAQFGGGLKQFGQDVSDTFGNFDLWLGQLNNWSDELVKTQTQIDDETEAADANSKAQVDNAAARAIVTDAVKAQLATLSQSNVAIQKELQEIIDSDEKIKESLKSSFGTFSDQLGKKGEELAKHLQQSVDKAKKQMESIQEKRDTKAFELSLEGKPINEQIDLTIAKVQRLREEGAKLFKDGAIEEGQKKFEEVDKLLDKVTQKELQSAKQSKEASERVLRSIDEKQDQKSFERSLANAKPFQATALINQKVDQLQGQAITLFNNGELEESRKKFEEIDKLLDKMYNDQASFRKEAEKLGVKFTTPLDDSKEQDITRLHEQLERSNIEKSQGRIQRASGEFGLINDIQQERINLEQAIIDKMESQYQKAKQLGDQLSENKRLQEQAAKDAAEPGDANFEGQQKAWGGLILPSYFADGGPVGTDTVPAWLSPGEYVMDSQNSAKFYPQLISMSQGITPSFSQSNRNTTVGDINLNFSGDNKLPNVRELANQLRRELRRGNITFDT